MKRLNAHIKGFRDGEAVSRVGFQTWTEGVVRKYGLVYVYAPFVLFQQMDDEWNVTHAASGYNVATTKRKHQAVQVIVRLRQAADWHFTSTTGAKAKRAVNAGSLAVDAQKHFRERHLNAFVRRVRVADGAE